MTGQPRYTRPHPDQRECALYYVDVLDPRTNYTTVCLGYIGETAREPFIRFMEHLYEQPFGDTIVGKPRVDPRVFAGKSAVLVAERDAVERLRPLYNYEWNLANPDRIPIPVARRQREGRDRARGVVSPVWGSAPRGRVRPRRERAPSRRRWSRRQKRVAMLAALWLVLAVAGWWASVHWAGLAVAGGAKAGVFTACAVFVVAWVNRRPRRRRR